MAAVARTFPAVVLLVVGAARLGAQANHATYPTITRAQIVANNALIGGTIAAAHAAIARRNPVKAFAVGAVGGAVHGFGKIAISRNDSLGILTSAVSAVGTSLVANAGRGLRIGEEITMPVGPARVRLYPYAADKVGFGVNAYDLAQLGFTFAGPGRRFNTRASMAAGTPVFDAEERLRILGGGALGVTQGSTITIGPNASPRVATYRHEIVHTRQHWFVQETVGRPIEDALRPRIPLVRRLPGWIELGVLVPSLEDLEWYLVGRNGGYRRWRETEAETLERR